MKLLLLLTLAALLRGQQADSHLAAARSAETAGDFAEAERNYERAVAAHPDSATYQRLGLVRHLQNKFAGAIAAFQSSLKLEPDQWACRLFLGIDLYRTNQFSNALAELAQASRLNPGEPEIQFWTGVTQLALKQYLPGLTALEHVSRQQPANLEVLRILAENYAAFGTALLNSVAEEYPDTPAGLTVHAQALEYEGAVRPALEAYQSIQERWPDRPGVREAIDRLKAAVSVMPLPSQQ